MSVGDRTAGEAPHDHRTVRIALRALVDIQDELAELTAALSAVPRLTAFAHAAQALVPVHHPTSRADADRIGRLAREVLGKPLALKPGEAAQRADQSALIDLGTAPDTILAIVELHLERLQQLLNSLAANVAPAGGDEGEPNQCTSELR